MRATVEKLNNVDIPSLNNQLLDNMNFYKSILNNTQKVKGLTHIIAGIDSLTNGAGNTNWGKYFAPRIKGELGNGGLGYIGFENATVSNIGSWNISGVSYISNLDPSNAPAKYSFDNKGIYTENATGTSRVWLYLTEKNFKYAKVIYLKQPGGGTFKAQYIDETDGVLVDTANDFYDLGVYKLPINEYPHKGEISLDTITGKVAIFGVYLYNDEGVIFSKIGKGGDKLSDHNKTDASFREKWLDILQPDIFIFNGGANDKGTLTPVQFDTTMRNYLTPYINKNTNLILVRQNEISGDTTLKLFEEKIKAYCKEKKCGFIDERKLLGETFEIANSLGYMIDTVHPSDVGNIKRANNYLDYFGVPKIGKLDDDIKKLNVSSLNYEYKVKLSQKQLSIANGETKTVYKIGLVGGYPIGIIQLNIFGQRTGTSCAVKKTAYGVVTNATTRNSAQSPADFIIKEEFEYHSDGIVTDFTLTTAKVNNHLEIYLSPNTGTSAMNFFVDGEITLPTLTVKGQSVFEN
ncbi:MAG: hypothetical protein GX896_09165 [Clostridiales bacterium]|nr:hypothetical protein [Clostridiales bacterium]